MSNKLQQIKEEAISMGYDFVYDMSNEEKASYIVKKCIEYAKSIVPTQEEVIEEFNKGNRTLRQFYLDRIDQDLHSLTK